MKYTLLELVQAILAALESDEVNSIDETADAEQVASIVKETYFELVSALDLPEHYDFIELTATSTSTPTIMTLPSNVLAIDWIKYDNKTTSDDGPLYKLVSFQDMDSFLNIMHSLDPGQSNIADFQLSTNSASVDIYAWNDKFPQYYTTFNDNTLIFDSYHVTYDSNLQSNKTLCYGLVAPTFTLSNTFTPDLDAKQFALLLSEAKAQAFEEMGRRTNPKAERRARQGWIRSQRDKRAIPFPHNGYSDLPDYGRKRP